MEEQKNNAQTEEAQEAFPLDDAAISLLADLKANIETLNAQWNGALVLFIRQHKLQGNWQLAPNGRELVLVRQGPRMEATK